MDTRHDNNAVVVPHLRAGADLGHAPVPEVGAGRGGRGWVLGGAVVVVAGRAPLSGFPGLALVLDEAADGGVGDVDPPDERGGVSE